MHFVLDKLEHLAGDKKSIFYKRFDQKNIGMFGHSMGGSTALKGCCFDARIKAAVDLDGALFGKAVTKQIGKPFMVMLAGNAVKINERLLTKGEWEKFGITSLEEEKKAKEGYLPALKQLAESAKQDCYTFVVEGAGHFDFTDIALLKNVSPFSRIAMKLSIITDSVCGSIDGLRATGIANDYLVNFFNKYLKGQPSELLDGKSKRYEEVSTR